MKKLKQAFTYEDGSEMDGREFERKFEAMSGRFKDMASADDIEFALAAEAAGEQALLERILNRDITESERRQCW